MHKFFDSSLSETQVLNFDKIITSKLQKSCYWTGIPGPSLQFTAEVATFAGFFRFCRFLETLKNDKN